MLIHFCSGSCTWVSNPCLHCLWLPCHPECNCLTFWWLSTDYFWNHAISAQTRLIAEGCDHLTGNVYSGVALGGSYDMGLAANPPFWAIQIFNIYLSLVHGSDHLRTRTWPFWTEPTVRSKVHHNQWTEPIVQFWVLQNPSKNQTKLNLTIPTTLSGELIVGLFTVTIYGYNRTVYRWLMGTNRLIHELYIAHPEA